MKFSNKLCLFIMFIAVFGVKNIKSFGFTPPWGYPMRVEIVDFYNAMNLLDEVLKNKNLSFDQRRELSVLFSGRLMNDIQLRGLRVWSYIYILDLISELIDEYYELDEESDTLPDPLENGVSL